MPHAAVFWVWGCQGFLWFRQKGSRLASKVRGAFPFIHGFENALQLAQAEAGIEMQLVGRLRVLQAQSCLRHLCKGSLPTLRKLQLPPFRIQEEIYQRLCVRVCVCVCARARVCAMSYTYINTYLPTYLPGCLPACVHVCMHACMHAYYTHTYTHTHNRDVRHTGT